jgi:two-component system sensor histidine kinase DevS
VAVLREALTNTARHAHATTVEVDVDTTSTSVSVLIADDGIGLGTTSRRSGLANLRDRAEQRGGALELTPAATPDPTQPTHQGTSLRWTIPLR